MPVSSVYSKGGLVSNPLDLILYCIVLMLQNKCFERIYLPGYEMPYYLLHYVVATTGTALHIRFPHLNQTRAEEWSRSRWCCAMKMIQLSAVFHCLWLWELSQGVAHLFCVKHFLFFMLLLSILLLCALFHCISVIGYFNP